MGLFSLGEDWAEKQSLIDQRDQEQAVTQMLTRPQTPVQQLVERDGGWKTAGKMLLNTLSGGLLTPVLHPELPGMRQQYASDMDLWKEYRKMSLVDPQDQAVADAIRTGVTGRELMALQAEAAGLDKLNLDQTTLSTGQIRYDAFGNQIAAGGDPVINPTAPMQNAAETARGYGIPVGSKAYADLVAAYAEPSGSRELADGTVVPFNTVDKVLADWRNGSYEQQSQAATGGQTNAVGVTADGGVTPDGATDATIRDSDNKALAENLKIADQKISFYNDLEGVISNFGEWDPEANDGDGGFVANEATRDNYGSVQNHPLYPGRYEMFKGDEEKDALAYMEQLVDMLTVDERGKLKGQGQITEGETAMLKRAVTVLQNRNLSDEAMQRELAKLMRGLIERRQKFVDLQTKYGKDGQGTPIGSNDIEQDIIDLDSM